MPTPLRVRLFRIAAVVNAGVLFVACQAAVGSVSKGSRPAIADDFVTATAIPMDVDPPLGTDVVADAGPPAPPAPPAAAPLGPLAQRIRPDLLVHGEKVDAAIVQKVASLVPPAQSAALRKGQVVLGLDDGAHPLPAAGIEPGVFRAFTPQGTAEVTAVWDAVGRGEIVVSHDAAKRLSLPLGGRINVVEPNGVATPFRIGAFADTGLAGVDVVVSNPIADRLALPGPNAVILAAGRADVDTLATAAKKAVPRAASSGSLSGRGAASRSASDASKPGVAIERLNQAVVSGRAFMNGSEAAKAFGVLPYTAYPDGTIVPDPGWVTANIVRAAVPILGKVTCHRLMIPQLGGALQDVVNAGLADKIHLDQYQGCYVPKLIEDSNSISFHAWGLAVDLNVPTNHRGTHGDMDPRVVSIFKSWGFRWGGDYVNSPPDPMHFELVALVKR